MALTDRVSGWGRCRATGELWRAGGTFEHGRVFSHGAPGEGRRTKGGAVALPAGRPRAHVCVLDARPCACSQAQATFAFPVPLPPPAAALYLAPGMQGLLGRSLVCSCVVVCAFAYVRAAKVQKHGSTEAQAHTRARARRTHTHRDKVYLMACLRVSSIHLTILRVRSFQTPMLE